MSSLITAILAEGIAVLGIFLMLALYLRVLV